jgi:hypothetical protein
MRRRRKATGLLKEEIAGLPGMGRPVLLFSEDMTMDRPFLLMILSAKLLVFSYLKYFPHDPPVLPID